MFCVLSAEHFHYLKRMIGSEFVGIGGDFDGVNRSVNVPFVLISLYAGFSPTSHSTLSMF